jgi:hypothetical protein
MRSEFQIEFVDVPEEQRQAIRLALGATQPPQACLRKHLFQVVNKGAGYWIGHREQGQNSPFLGHLVESIDPVKIAQALRRLTGCW